MKSLVKIFCVLIISIFPMFLIIGFARLATHGFSLENISFLPTSREIMNMFNNAPDFLGDIRNEINAFSKEMGNVDWGFNDKVASDAWLHFQVYQKNVKDLITFFEAVGAWFDYFFKVVPLFFNGVAQFFSACSHLFVILWYAIKTPFEFLGWFFGSFLGFIPMTA